MATQIASTVSPGWLRSGRFDLGFIFGIAVIALFSGLICTIEPRLFPVILVLDIWLLGYQHVISTFTRLCFDKESFRQHRFLVLQLPFIVAACTITLAFGVGFWTLGTIYLYWQWFHYTRQSWGVAQVYRRKSNGLVVDDERFSLISFYLLPAAGILSRSWQQPTEFLGLEVRTIPVPGELVVIVSAFAIAALLVWGFQRIAMWMRGELPVAHTLYLISHFAIFATGYILIEDVTYGWLVINIWHNAQYVAFVWLFNNQRFREGTDPKASFLSHISQRANWWKYFAVCLALSSTVYLAIMYSTSALFAEVGLPIAIIVYQTINFHHYVVDGIIWKARKKPMQKTLGLSEN
ncbi:MAG: hypothetical protein R3C97_18140 [Geminicoccaceae bacterium]